jgi:hypothetical protein
MNYPGRRIDKLWSTSTAPAEISDHFSQRGGSICRRDAVPSIVGAIAANSAGTVDCDPFPKQPLGDETAGLGIKDKRFYKPELNPKQENDHA